MIQLLLILTDYINKHTVIIHNNYQGHTVCLPSKPSNEVFPCVYFAAYGYLPGFSLRNGLKPSHPHHHFGLSGAVFRAT